MTERQGKLVGNIQGCEGNDQKTESIISLFPGTYKREWSVKKMRRKLTEVAPLQDDDRAAILDNADMGWRALPSHLTGKEPVCSNTLCERRAGERKGRWNASSATAMLTAWGARRTKWKRRESTCLSGTPKLKPWQRSSPCALADAGGCVWKAEPSSCHDTLAARVADQYWSCQQRPREVALPYLFLRGTRVFRALPAGQRLHTTKRPSQEAFEPQPLRQKHRAAAGVKSQPRAPHHDGQLCTPARCSAGKAACRGTASSRVSWSPARRGARLTSHTERTRASPRCLPTATTLLTPRGEPTASARAFQHCGLWSGLFLFWREAEGWQVREQPSREAGTALCLVRQQPASGGWGGITLLMPLAPAMRCRESGPT